MAQRTRAGNGLDVTLTDTLVPRPETGKISRVRRLRYGRLSPGARKRQRRPRAIVSEIQSRQEQARDPSYAACP